MKYYFLILIVITSITIKAQTKIEWLNSNPGGSLLNCFCSINDSIFYAAGTNGIIAKSMNNGKSWIIIDALKNSIAEFRKIYFYDKNNGVILGDVKPMENSKIYYTQDGGLSWTETQYQFNVHINDWTFLSAQKGIALGPYELYKTDDGGKTWRKEVLEIGYVLASINKNADGSLCISGSRVISWGNKFTPRNIAGAVIISRDGGSNWEKLKEFNDKIVVESYFLDEQNGIVCCYDGTTNFIYKTNNGGQSFDEKKRFQAEIVKDLLFPIKDIGILAVNRGIEFTDNQGETWNTRYTDGSTILSLFNIGKTVYTIGSAIRVSSDLGYNWKNIAQSITGRIEMIDENTLFLFNENGILKSTDHGNTWNQKSDIVSNGSSFVDSQIGTIIKLSGEIYRTENGGDSWSQQSSYMPIYLADIKLYNKKIGVAVGAIKSLPDSENGTAIYTIDGGKTWKRSSINAGNLNAIEFADKLTWFTVGPEGTIYKSVDGGKTWNLNFKLGKSYLLDISFATRELGYAVGSNGVVLKTTNCGNSWEPVNFNQGENDYIRSVKFYGQFGVIANESGYLFITTDYGENWTSKFVGIAPYKINVYKNTCIGSIGSIIRFEKEGQFIYGKSIVNGSNEDKDTTNLKLVTDFLLEQNYPNPFNGTTAIKYSIPIDTELELNIYNSIGQLVDRPIKSYKTKARYTYYYSPANLSSGIYFYEIVTADNRIVKKMIYIK
jgi:photosystem II stability/assembly factor-like uncharacterized protein